MKTRNKRRVATSLLLAAGTLAVTPGPASAACGDAAGPAVDWIGCDKTGENLNAVDLSGAFFDSTILTDADMAGADLTDVNAVDSILGGTATMAGATVDGLILTRSEAAGTDMTGLVRNDALSSPEVSPNTLTFTGANLTGVDFTGADVYDASFVDANLTNAVFTGADIRNSEFIRADLTGATFDASADVSGTNFAFTPDGMKAVDEATTDFETAVNIDVLANDENLNGTDHGRTFTAENVSTPANGTAVVQGDGTITYTPNGGFSGEDTFTYEPTITLPASWALPTIVGKVVAGDPVTVTVTVEAEVVDPDPEPEPEPEPEPDPILSEDFQGMSGIEGRIARLYAAFFHRDPDAGGFAFWKARIEAGDWTNDNAAQFFSESQEFIDTYGADLTDEEYIILVYANVLDRKPDAGGQAYWLGQLAAGVSRGTVMLQFSDSPEFKEITKTS